MTSSEKTRVLILGGGYVGLYTAWGLQKQLGNLPLDITVLEPNPYMTYQPLLPEVAGGHVLSSDVAVNLRRTLKKCHVLRGELASLDCEGRTAEAVLMGGKRETLTYDHVVFALGAITRVFPTPGLEEHAVGFKTIEEADYVRNTMLNNIALAAATSDPEVRRRALTFVFIGGGYTGVEAMAELLDLSKTAIKDYPELEEKDLKWVLVEALDRVAQEVGPELSEWTLHRLRERGIDVRLKTTMKSCEDAVVELSDGDKLPSGLIVWTAGVTPNPVLDKTDVPRGPKGHVNANTRMQVIREDESVVEGTWAAGDNAQILNLTEEKQPAYYPPNAQNAVRQAKLLARNIAAAIRGEEIQEYRHKSLGALAEFGVGKGAANIRGLKLRGLPAWLAHRGYHGMALPTFNRKWRVVTRWLTDAVAKPNVSSLSAVENPRRDFVEGLREQREQRERQDREKKQDG